jgi:protein-ribulosamine 3-kinase
MLADKAVLMDRVIEEKILNVLKNHFKLREANISKSFVSGGSLNETYRVEVEGRKVFCKINSANKFPQLFEKERRGLEILTSIGNINTPQVIDCFEIENSQVLVMEWIEPAQPGVLFWKNFGRSLAKMHSVITESFGFEEDNYMGVVPQSNRKHDDWITFFRQERLEPLCIFCYDKGLLTHHHKNNFEKLNKRLDDIFDSNPVPSLLHGDLWNGNFIPGRYEQVVLIDPAVYFGHSAVDLGMTTLFGGFPSVFYESYDYHLPFPANYRQQWRVANLYPLLIHLYLFGRSYLSEIGQTLSEFE